MLFLLQIKEGFGDLQIQPIAQPYQPLQETASVCF
jgi:hypothetical protein